MNFPSPVSDALPREASFQVSLLRLLYQTPAASRQIAELEQLREPVATVCAPS